MNFSRISLNMILLLHYTLIGFYECEKKRDNMDESKIKYTP